MLDENKKPSTLGQRARATALKIFLCAIPVAIILTIINKCLI